MTIAPSPRQSNGPAGDGVFRLRGLWARLTRCEAEDCRERPVHLGWCALHTPGYEPGPDEYWGDPESDQRPV